MEEELEPEEGSEPGAVEAPTPVLLRQCTVLVVQAEGPSFPDEDFPVGCFEVPAADSDPSSIAIVVVAELDHRLVVCVPFHSWHRIVNKRVLPPRALVKPVLLELPCVDRADTDTEVSSFKFWLGILAPEFEDYIVFDAVLDLGEFDYKFVPDSPYTVPIAASLVEAFDRHFGFASATSGTGTAPAAPLPGSSLDARLQALEKSVASLAEIA